MGKWGALRLTLSWSDALQSSGEDHVGSPVLRMLQACSQGQWGARPLQKQRQETVEEESG